MNSVNQLSEQVLYLFYDGDCILCRNTAQALKLKKSVGQLKLINAREPDPLVKEVLDKGYDLNEGIIVYYKGHYFYGPDAIHFLALMGSNWNLFNKLNVSLFKYKRASQIFYPIFKAVRKILLLVRKIPPMPIPAQAPLIEKIFGQSTSDIPLVLKKRYSNRSYSKDVLVLRGKVAIEKSSLFKALSSLFKSLGVFIPESADNILSTVELISDNTSNQIMMHRTFTYPDSTRHHLISRIIHVKDNIVLELLRFGFASRLLFCHDGKKIIIKDNGYVFRLGKRLVPIPIGFLIGKLSAYEEAISECEFRMLVELTHPLFGLMFRYAGDFSVVNSSE